jgi:hypothetical protein
MTPLFNQRPYQGHHHESVAAPREEGTTNYMESLPQTKILKET